MSVVKQVVVMRPCLLACAGGARRAQEAAQAQRRGCAGTEHTGTRRRVCEGAEEGDGGARRAQGAAPAERTACAGGSRRAPEAAQAQRRGFAEGARRASIHKSRT